MKQIIVGVCLLAVLFISPAPGQIIMPYTIQGFLKDGNVPANGNYDISYALYDTQTGGVIVGGNEHLNVRVVNGVFSFTENGNSEFMTPGRTLWIEFGFKPAFSQQPYTILAPRQRMGYVPFAVSSLDSMKLGGREANQYLTTSAAAASFIQNGTTPQNGSFTILGAGTADEFSANRFIIRGNRVLSAEGLNNIFAGASSGALLTSGNNNAFFGVSSGAATTFGAFNSFVGRNAGLNNAGGAENSFFGSNSGVANISGNGNTLLGARADASGDFTNSTAIGYRAFVTQSNSLVLGSISGVNGATADTRVGIGTTAPAFKLQVVDPGNAGLRVVTQTAGGTLASFAGNGSFVVDTATTPGGRLTILENGNAGFGINNPTFKLQVTDSSNRGLRVANLGFGGTVASFGANGAFQVDALSTPGGRLTILENGNVGIGLNNPTYKFQITDQTGNGFGLRVLTTSPGGTVASFGGNGSFLVDTVATPGGRFMILENGNVGIGGGFLTYKLQVTDEGNAGFRVLTNTAGGTVASFGGRGEFLVDTIATPGGRFTILENGNVGIGVNNPIFKLQITDEGNTGLRVLTSAAGGTIASFGGLGQFRVDTVATPGGRFMILENGNVGINSSAPNDRLSVGGIISMSTLGAGGATALCRNASNQISTCSSSLRYKDNVRNYTPGLDLIRRLRPVSFNWKANNEADFGLVAEETAAVEPLLTTVNDKGETEGVKYDRVGVVLVNAVNEQQTEIEALERKVSLQNETIGRQAGELQTQREEIERQRAELDALKRLVCSQNPSAELCRSKKED